VKTAGASLDLDRAAELFRALADPTRLAIVQAVAAAGEECVCNLTDTLESGQSRLSFHLKALKNAGLLVDRRDGRWVYYSLNPDTVDDVRRLLTSITRA
jgi:ArsR family transcriptional regulator